MRIIVILGIIGRTHTFIVEVTTVFIGQPRFRFDKHGEMARM